MRNYPVSCNFRSLRRFSDRFRCVLVLFALLLLPRSTFAEDPAVRSLPSECPEAAAQALSSETLNEIRPSYTVEIEQSYIILFVERFNEINGIVSIAGPIARFDCAEYEHVLARGASAASDGNFSISGTLNDEQRALRGELELNERRFRVLGNQGSPQFLPVTVLQDYCGGSSLNQPPPCSALPAEIRSTPSTPSDSECWPDPTPDPDDPGSTVGAPAPPDAEPRAARTRALDETGVERSEIDLLVAYTPRTLEAAGNERAIELYMRGLIGEVNATLVRSEVEMMVRLVGLYPLREEATGVGVTDLVQITEIDGKWDDIHAVRAQLGADVVTLLLDDYLRESAGSQSKPLCGLGWIPRTGTPVWAKDKAFNVFAGLFRSSSEGYCGARVYAHELGHNFGLDHDRFHSVGGGAFDDSYGHRFFRGQKLYATIMSYLDPNEWEYGYGLNYFSNSDLRYRGEPMGVVDYANEAYSLNRVREFVANHQSRAFLNVRGKVQNGSQGIPGAKIFVNGVRATRTNIHGEYNALAPTGTALTITVERGESQFSPAQRQLGGQSLDVENQDFSLETDTGGPGTGPSTYRIYVSATVGGAELEDAIFYINGAPITRRTSSGDLYAEVSSGSSHMLSAFHPQYSFMPPTVLVSNIKSDESRVFQATLGNGWISGYVWNAQNQGAQGVSIEGNGGLIDDSGLSTTNTIWNGSYRFVNARNGAIYLLTPHKSGFHFFPPQAQVLADDAVIRVDFKIRSGEGDTLGGVITDQFGQPVPGADLEIACAHPEGEFTIEGVHSDFSGSFQAIGLPIGSECTITPSKPGYSFVPTPGVTGAKGSVTIAATRINATVRGSIRLRDGSPLSGVLLHTERGPQYSNAEGGFSLEAPVQSALTILPSSERYYFVPPQYSIPAIGESQSSYDFIAVSLDKPVTDITIIGKPQYSPVPQSDGKPAAIDFSITFANPTGIAPDILWQIRKARGKVGRKLVFQKWKRLKNDTGARISLPVASLRPGIYEIRSWLRIRNGSDRNLYSKPTRFKIKPSKKKRR